jgi:hypothetical protein
MLRGSVADAVMHSTRMSMLVFKPDKIAAKEAESFEEGVKADLILA